MGSVKGQVDGRRASGKPENAQPPKKGGVLFKGATGLIYRQYNTHWHHRHCDLEQQVADSKAATAAAAAGSGSSMAAEVAQQHAAPADGSMQERLEWVKQMRGQFSPEGMCGADGEIDQDFFKPKNIIIRLKDDEKWGPPQKEALYKVRGRRSARAPPL